MKLKSIEIHRVCIPLKTPFITALRRVDSIEFIRVHLECDNGFEAIGEAPATKAITGEDLETIEHSLQSIHKQLLSKTPQKALEILHASEIGTSAKASLDMAFISLLAQEKEEELYRFLGAKKKSTLQTDITVSLNSHTKMLKDSISYVQSGYSILKVKLGGDIEHAIAVTQSITQALPEAKLIIDANQAWSYEDSLKYIEALQGNISIELIEQPVIAKDIASLAKITHISSFPVLADEAVFSLEDANKIIQTKSADMINIKLMKCGGLSKAVEILDYAREHRVRCMLGSMLEGPYSINAALHLALAYEDIISYVDLDSPLLYAEPQEGLDFVFSGSHIFLEDTKG